MFPTRISKPVTRKLLLAGTAFYLHTITIAVSQAATGVFGNIPNIASTPASGSLRTSISNILTFILGFLALVALIFVVVGGIRILTAGGNDEQVTKGRKTIVYALIGLIVVLFARVIVGFVSSETVTHVVN